MRIETYGSEVAARFKEKILEENLLFGRTNEFSALITPSITVITHQEKNDIVEDLHQLWQLYRTTNEMYLQSLAGAADPLIKNLAEAGLHPEEVQIQREVAKARIEPRSCRVDYLGLGEGRKIAEVQWKSDGPGLMLGTQVALSEVVPFASGMETFGDSVQNFRLMIANGQEGQVVAVNDNGAAYANGEAFMVRRYAGTNLTYVPVLRDRFSDYVFGEDGRIFVKTADGALKVDFVYLFLSPFSKGAPEGDKKIHSLIVKSCLD